MPQYLDNAPVSPCSIVTFITETEKNVLEEILQHLNSSHDITGVFCYNDKIATHLVSNLVSKGWNIPEELSVIGCDDAALTQITPIDLTTIEHPKELLGIDVVKWIISTIENGKPGNSILYHPKLIKRNSVKSLN